jgi:glutathione S-transferase
MPPAHPNRTESPYLFHAFEVSYFSAKVRSALRYKGVWVDERRADHREIMRRTGMRFIPMVITPDGETWQDSTEIYKELEVRHPDPPLFPDGPLQCLAAHLVEIYTDEFGLIPAMHYRWGTPLAEEVARARFSAMTGNEEIGNKAADRMVAARFLVGASVEAGTEIEAHTRDLLDALSAHHATHPYLLGARQSFADCALMGVIDGHLFHDLVSRELLLKNAMQVVGWIDRCNYPNQDEQGEWLEGDALAPTLIKVLSAMGRDAAPVILEIVREIEEWADANPGAKNEIPAPIKIGKISLRGVSADRMINAYTLFSLQQVLDHFRALTTADQIRITSALAETGWNELLAYEPRHRVEKKNFKLVIESN